MAKQTLAQAKAMVPAYIEPRDCFVEFQNTASGFRPLSGTPCAHYVSHALGLKSKAGGYGCSAGMEVRVRALVQQLNEVKLEQVQVNDVWARLKGDATPAGSKEPTDHCGVVVAVERSDGKVNIKIRHNSSGQQKVATDTWDYFARGGKFYRAPSASAFPSATQSNLFRARNQLPLRA